MSSALVLVADGSEEIETLTPVDYLRRAGVDTKLVSVKEGKSVVMSHGVKLEADCDGSLICECLSKSELPDAVVVPGGMPGSTNIAENEDVREFIKEMNAGGKLVCAICAAPAVVLPATGALDGRDWTCYPGMEDRLIEAEYVDDAGVVTDGNIITGRGMGVSVDFGLELLKALRGEQAADIIKHQIQHPETIKK